MNDIQLVQYDYRYLDSLLKCWNETLIYDPINKDRFLNLIIFDENFDESLFSIALYKDEVIGCCIGFKRKVSYYTKGLEPDRGWINYLFVKEEFQNQGVGTKLYDDVEKKLQAMGTKEITLCAYSPNYLNPGIDIRYTKGINFFKKKNYPFGGDSVSMQRTLWDFEMPEKTKQKMLTLKEKGIQIASYKNEYYSNLMSFLEEFEPGWKRNVIIALQKGEAENTILLCLNKNNEVMGYCMRKIDGNDARFGPIGVSQKLRSKGLGGVLFDCMMLEMKKRGIPGAYFLWTSGDAIRFYKRHGMQIYRTYKTSRKELYHENL